MTFSVITASWYTFSGDKRSNVWNGLTAIHELFVREHNRIARVFYKMLGQYYPSLSDERIDELAFQETRRILAAQFQVREWLQFAFHTKQSIWQCIAQRRPMYWMKKRGIQCTLLHLENIFALFRWLTTRNICLLYSERLVWENGDWTSVWTYHTIPKLILL